MRERAPRERDRERVSSSPSPSPLITRPSRGHHIEPFRIRIRQHLRSAAMASASATLVMVPGETMVGRFGGVWLKIGDVQGTLGADDRRSDRQMCLVSHEASAVLAKARAGFFICPHDGGFWVRIAWESHELETRKRKGEEKDDEEKKEEKKEDEEEKGDEKEEGNKEKKKEDEEEKGKDDEEKKEEKKEEEKEKLEDAGCRCLRKRKRRKHGCRCLRASRLPRPSGCRSGSGEHHDAASMLVL